MDDIERQIVALLRQDEVHLASPRVVPVDGIWTVQKNHEVSILLDVIRRLRDSGVAIVFVSHRLDELYAVCDTITVLKARGQMEELIKTYLDEYAASTASVPLKLRFVRSPLSRIGQDRRKTKLPMRRR